MKTSSSESSSASFSLSNDGYCRFSFGVQHLQIQHLHLVAMTRWSDLGQKMYMTGYTQIRYWIDLVRNQMMRPNAWESDGYSQLALTANIEIA